ncbi:hypothetical protein DSM43518_03314 [Mycobacterium marinum]|uniref:hypothetical protein n=1 Tax=Mycobacterium marinum TaxID=1781 RepID=UPI000E3C0B02|nr:hypothetical protein [Mycobacterium marinum]RFZ07572.1 hypothetical protein DSM43518_03314 [Mycobacterium marinum]
MTGVRWVRVATAGRRFRTYVGRLPGGRKIPGGARPIEQIVGFTATLIATIFATRLLPYNAVTIFGTGLIFAIGVTAALSLIKYDGVPVLGKTARILGLMLDRKPTVIAREELDRQAASNPNVFVADDAAAVDAS